MSSTTDAKNVSLEAIKAGYLAAIEEMKAAKSGYEVAKAQLDAVIAFVTAESDTAAAKQAIEISELKKRLDECCKGKKAMQNEEGQGLKEKVKELEKQLLQCRNKEVINRRVGNPMVFMDVDISGKPAGRIVIELFKDTTPRTAENFRALCTGEKGVARNGNPLHYKGSVFHSMEPKSHINGGDIPAGESIYGETWSTPENLVKQHSGPGDIWKVLKWEGIHWSIFVISLRRMDEYNGKSVVVGRVVEGMNVVWEMEKAGGTNSVIADCGELP